MTNLFKSFAREFCNLLIYLLLLSGSNVSNVVNIINIAIRSSFTNGFYSSIK